MKKKILSILLCGVACVAAASSALPSQYAKYDLNGDGQLTADDASVIYSYILGTADEAVTLAQVDVNGDGTVNTADVVEVYVAVREKGIKGWGADSDDSEFGGAKERRGTWGNLWETEN
ncbi:MAG: dockerin type I repeat-containing protein [Bacteroidaceae bacterium]|nr:dockerin type I repeat-containing protein [Bacteroidaceae bacterium]